MNFKIHFFKPCIVIQCVFFVFFTHSAYSQITVNTVNLEIIGENQQSIDINNDGTNDLQFEIISIPAVRAIPLNGTTILDNSTYGYADALNINQPISGNFTNQTVVLGTFSTAGNFNGQGDKYLGVKLFNSLQQTVHYAWVLLNCSENNDTLKIIKYAFEASPSVQINAGQTVSNVKCEENSKVFDLTVYPTISTDFLTITNQTSQIINYDIIDNKGVIIFQGKTYNGIKIDTLQNGVYILRLYSTFDSKFVKFIKIEN